MIKEQVLRQEEEARRKRGQTGCDAGSGAKRDGRPDDWMKKHMEGGRPPEPEAEDARSILDCLADANLYYLTGDAGIELERQKLLLEPEDSILFHVREVTYEDEAPWKEALENVLSTARIPGVNFIYLLLGGRSGVRFYYGLSRDYSTRLESSLHIREIGKNVLEASIAGNFRGSDVVEVPAKEKAEVLESVSAKNMPYAARIEGVPGSVKDGERFQSVDRLVDVMQGEPFCLLAVAKALTPDQVKQIEQGIYAAYTQLSPALKVSGQESRSEGRSWSSSETEGYNMGESESASTSASATTPAKSGTAACQDATITGKTDTEGTSFGRSYSAGGQNGINEGRAWTRSKEYMDCGAREWIKYCDDVILPRLDYGRGKGLFASALYVMAQKKDVLVRLVNTTRSLYSGKQGNRVPLRHFSLPQSGEGQRGAIQNLQLPAGYFRGAAKRGELHARAFLSQLVQAPGPFPIGNWITTNELAMIAGLPRKEVVGMRLREEVEFGLNCGLPDEKDRIELGRLVQNGKDVDIPVYLDKQALDKHLFVAGVTGSGKTTTCQNILLHSGLPFLVIEPVKTEYRILKNKIPNLIVFTLGDDEVAPFRMNPFEFMPRESISAHVDMVKASIEAAFDMEAAIPQIIENALYCCYQDYGWDVRTGKNEKFREPFAPGACAFPQLSDLLKKIPAVVKEQGFDARLQNDYIGSIRARLQSLTLGAKGSMLDSKRSIDWFSLLDKQVVFELDGIKSGSEKSLIMGFVLAAFGEAVRERYLRENDRASSSTRHILLVEEAHRLLSRYMPGDSRNKKHGVEVFSDMLAEVRKYGQCLIVADQIPNKMAEDVLKNTNTKIVHRLFAQDDKEAVGNTMALSEEQKQFLSSLGTGRAVLFADHMGQAMQVHVQDRTDTSSAPLPDEELRRRVFQYYWSEEENRRPVFLRPHIDPFSMEDPDKRDRLLRFIQSDIPYLILCDTSAESWSRDRAELLEEMLEWGAFECEELTRWGMAQMPDLAAKLGTQEEEEPLQLGIGHFECYIQGRERMEEESKTTKIHRYYK